MDSDFFSWDWQYLQLREGRSKFDPANTNGWWTQAEWNIRVQSEHCRVGPISVGNWHKHLNIHWCRCKYEIQITVNQKKRAFVWEFDGYICAVNEKFGKLYWGYVTGTWNFGSLRSSAFDLARDFGTPRFKTVISSINISSWKDYFGISLRPFIFYESFKRVILRHSNLEASRKVAIVWYWWPLVQQCIGPWSMMNILGDFSFLW